MEQEQKQEETIILLNTEKTWGGGEKWFADMAGELLLNGYNIQVICQPGSELSKKLTTEAIPVQHIKINNLSFLNIVKILKLGLYFKHHKVRTVLMNLPSDVKTGGLAARMAGVPNIIYRRGSARAIKNSWLNRFLFKHVITRLIVNSLQTKETVLKNNPSLIPNERISLVYNGIRFKEISSEYRNRDVFIIGNAGRLSPEKGQYKLLQLAQILKKSGLNFKIIIAGTGPLKEQLQQQITDNDLEDCVELAGFVADFDNFLHKLDIFVLSSEYEGFGYVMVEAMASRKPVIAFDIGTTSEIIVHEITGYIAAKNNVNIMADYVKHLYKNPAVVRQMGEQGRQVVLSKFSYERSFHILKQLI